MKEKIRKLFSNVWTIPNVLTIIRMLLIPVFVVLFFHEEEIKVASLCVFCAASLTDMLDGYLARKLNQITDFGKLFDPLADKLMVITAMVCQTFWGPLPLIAVIIVAAKELLIISALRLVSGKCEGPAGNRRDQRLCQGRSSRSWAVWCSRWRSGSVRGKAPS